MKGSLHTSRPHRRKEWMFMLARLVVLQLLFIAFDHASWTPFKVKEGSLFDDLSQAKLFTEWFAPYKTASYNLFTAIFAITLLPAALIGALKDLSSRK